MLWRIVLALLLIAGPAWAITTKIPAGSIKFTPDDGAEWTNPDPTEVDAALEAMIVRLVAEEAGVSRSKSVVDAYIENVADGEFFDVLRHFDVAHTATKIHCQCFGSGTIVASWKNDDGSPVLVDAAAITCDALEEDADLTGDPTFIAGSNASLTLGTITGTPAPCYFAMYVTED